MRNGVAVRLVCSVVMGLIPLTLWARAKGPDVRHTAAPGDSPVACSSAGCHTSSVTGGPINFHGGGVTASFSAGSTYTPGTPVTITVRVSDPINSQYGFQMTARPEGNLANEAAGRFSYPSGSGVVVLCDDGTTEGAVRTPSGNCPARSPVEFIEHSEPSTGSWSFTWNPPATAVGPVRFYVAGNAVNGDLSSDGNDHVYTASYTLTPSLGCTSAAPVVTGVISAGAFGARTDFTSGSWLEIYGSNFSNGLKLWDGADFSGLAAPISLDRVRAQVNGKDAFTWVVSPGQLNVQAPDNAGTGPMTVTVTNCDQTSAPKTITQAAIAPGVWAPPTFTSGGKQLLGATTADGLSVIGTIAGVPSRPAKPGEMIITYGVGFGTTNPVIPAGQINPGLAPLVDPFVMTIGGTQITGSALVYAGLAPGFVGLYQFNVIVPNMADGDQPVTIKIGNTTIPQTLVLSVKR
ncbi:MAG: choice-of-anchor V domain-containing protein [Bryobacteraceae bacterium]